MQETVKTSKQHQVQVVRVRNARNRWHMYGVLVAVDQARQGVSVRVAPWVVANAGQVHSCNGVYAVLGLRVL